MFRRLLKRAWRARRVVYDPLVEVHINQARLTANLRAFQALDPRVSVAPVLKSNAYGHGLVEVARILEGESVPFLCVDSYFEVRVLRDAGITAPLLVLGYSRPEYILKNCYRDVSFAITTLEQLEQLKHANAPSAHLHVKIDTGMHRQGLAVEELEKALRIFESNAHLKFDGLCSHFSDADNPDATYTERQIKLWNAITARVRDSASNTCWYHIAATAGAERYLNEIDSNVIRAGIGIYRNVLSLHTIVARVADIRPGDIVGYARTFVARERMKVATVPIGYFEGVDRRLSNKGVMIIGERACPIIGRVSMNMTTIDVSEVSDVRVDTPVVAISDNPDHPNSVDALAKLCGTIPHEILVRIPEHLRRVVV